MKNTDSVGTTMLLESDSKALGKYAFDIDRKYTTSYPNYIDYLPYDELFYHYLASDRRRNDAYRKAIEATVADQTVVEIGTGSELLLALMCVTAGARKVYAIEVNEDAFKVGQELIIAHGLGAKIELLLGSSLDIDLPEPADVCVSELLGVIGNCEGAMTFLNDARRRFLKPGGIMIPDACLTLLCPVEKPSIHYDLLAEAIHDYYIKKVFDRMEEGFVFPYDLVSNFPREHFLAPPQIFEELRFCRDSGDIENFRTLCFSVEKPLLFDGLLLWLNIHMFPNQVLDCFAQTNWLPVHVSIDPCPTQTGDTIEIHCHTTLGGNGINPCYSFEVSVLRQAQEIHRTKRVINYDRHYATIDGK